MKLDARVEKALQDINFVERYEEKEQGSLWC